MQIPADAAGLTADWLSGALAQARGGPFGPVGQVERQRIGEAAGVLTDIYRLNIIYAPGSRPGPASLVVKLPGSTPEARSLSNNYGFYAREVAFYRDIARTVAVAAPACFGAAFDPESRLFVLLLEDLAAATPIDRLAGMTEIQVRRAVREIVPLHARWWRDPQLRALEDAIPAHGQPPWDTTGQMHAAAWETTAAWMKDRIGPKMMWVGERLCSDLQGLMARNGQGQRTLCHGDFHGDNMMFTGDPADPRTYGARNRRALTQPRVSMRAARNASGLGEVAVLLRCGCPAASADAPSSRQGARSSRRDGRAAVVEVSLMEHHTALSSHRLPAAGPGGEGLD